MSRKLPIILLIITLLATTLSCQLLTGQPTAPQPVAQDTPVAVKPEAAPTATVDFAATAAAEEQSAQATSDAAALEATRAAEALEAVEATSAARDALESTAMVEAQATDQAAGIYNEVVRLEKQGDIRSAAGNYYTVENFEENWAQIGWYQWWNTGYQPRNFVIRAHTAWESASRTADWFNAGCGFVFRATDEKNHYMIYLALDGNVYMKGYVDGKFRELGREWYGTVERVKGEADVLLAVDGSKITYYVNGEKIFQRENEELSSGDLALTLVSGTNKDYGTRCAITDVELWALDTP